MNDHVRTGSNRKQVSFIYSPEVYYEQNSGGARFTPLWAYTLSAYVPDSWDLSIHDCTIVNRSEIRAADVFAFSGINQDFHTIKSTCHYLKGKYPWATFILGGPITWSYEKDGRLNELEYFDHIFILDGEETFPDFLNRFAEGKPGTIEKIIRASRFPVKQAKKLRFDLLGPVAKRYYGGVMEVSRGCPYLCEFCDVRVLPSNNESHNKAVHLIVEELAEYYRLGIRQVQLACDNFIGDVMWARECVEAILAWVEKTGAKLALYTWTTVNISKMPDLMSKMRRAGFTSLFIGVESFNANSILETAKVQNRNEKNQMTEAIRTIQSYGFIIVPGLIFGFDSDPPSMFHETLKGILESGLIGGDPTFLLALPGTPLYARMKRTHRIVDNDESEQALPLYKQRVSKIESNIKYLQPREFLIRGFMRFIKDLTSGEIMYARFKQHVGLMMNSPDFVPVHSIGYGSLPEYLKFQFSSWLNLSALSRRVFYLLRPRNLWAILKAYGLVLKYRGKYKGLKNHFTFWLFLWSNLIMKYNHLRYEDFGIHSIEDGYRLGEIWNDLDFRDSDLLANGKNPDQVKVADQGRRTREALGRLKQTLGTTYSLSDFRIG